MKNKLAVFASLCAMFTLIAASSQIIEAARFALKLCAELIIPSLFPFFILSGLLNRLGFASFLSKYLSGAAARLFGVSGAGITALFVGLTGGYPLGAVYIAGMAERGVITSDEGEKLLGFCNNTGPAFIIGAVGAGIYHSVPVGLALYASHIIAALLTGLILCRKSKRSFTGAEYIPVKPDSFYIALPAAVKDAVTSILNICGFAVCFTVFSGLLDANGQLSLLTGALSHIFKMPLQWLRALLSGIIELSSGVGNMQGFAISPQNIALSAFILGWGGISVHFQTLSAIADTNIKGTLHLAGRLISSILGAALAYLMTLVFFRT